MSILWQGKRLFNHCGVAGAILEEASKSYGIPSDLEEAKKMLEDADSRLDAIYQLAGEIERMGIRMDDGLRDKEKEIERLLDQLEKETT